MSPIDNAIFLSKFWINFNAKKCYIGCFGICEVAGNPCKKFLFFDASTATNAKFRS